MDFSGDVQALLSFQGLVSLIILSLLELILGIDNIIFISLLLTKIPAEKRFRTRVIALSLAFVMRIIMLFCLVWLSHITTGLFTVFNFTVNIRDILFFIGGAYLVFNTLKELVNGNKPHATPQKQPGYKSIILQVVLADVLFSFDSIFTAIGIIQDFIIMALAVGIGMLFMIYLAGKTSAFIERNPRVKILALYFIIAVGLMLITQAFHIEIPKTYLYLLLGGGFAVERIYAGFKKR